MLTSFAGSDIVGESYGAGRPFVLALHGWRRDHTDFSATLSAEPPAAAIALDLPGFGGTPAPAAAWGTPEYAEALVPILDLMESQVILLGHSFGGRVAVHLAGRQRDRVAGMVLTAVPLFRAGGARRKPPLKFRAVRRLAKAGLVSDETLETYRQRYGSADYRAASGVIRGVLVRALAEEYDDAIAEVTCPVELVWGDDDTVVPLTVAEQIRDSLPNGANLVVCAGAGHLTPLTAGGELRAAIDRLRP